MTNVQMLADTLDKTRSLTRYYLSSLKDVDATIRPEVNGAPLNCIAWQVAHLAWAENFLVLHATSGPVVEIDWLDHYKLGSDGSLHVPQPDMKELMSVLNQIHAATMAHLQQMPDDLLEQTCKLGFGFGGDSTNRMMIQHCIRHEGMHTGHISWLAKMLGKKLI